MWNDDSESLANVWEFLASQSEGCIPLSIHKGTGVPVGRVLAALKDLQEIEIVELKKDVWSLKRTLSAMDWARAVEVGVPLSSLEKFSALSVQEKKKAQKAIESGLIDEERETRDKKKKEERQKILRGRAATRAAATDLAKILEDAQKALAEKKSPVNDIFRKEAHRALEALISAMEK